MTYQLNVKNLFDNVYYPSAVSQLAVAVGMRGGCRCPRRYSSETALRNRRMKASRTILGRIMVVALAATWLGASMAPSHADEITLYSSREANLVEPVIAAFTEASGIRVKLVFIEDNLVKRLQSGGRRFACRRP